jgi:murein DD-endopeptidase MepM/ murein hydrolase activator NlpD
MQNRFLLLIVAVVLSACAPKFEPPPGFKGGFLWNEGKSRTVTVEQGDTLYTISRRYNVPTRAIIARNGLQSPFELRVGQQLILDPAMSYRIEAGDTLSKIARQYGVEMRLIAAANDLVAPYTIYPGQMLWIPDPFSVAAAPVNADLPPVNVAVPSGSAPRSTPIARENLTPPPGEPQPMTAPLSRPQPAPAPLSQPPMQQSQQLPPPQAMSPQSMPREVMPEPVTAPQPLEQAQPVQIASLPPEPKPLTAPPPRAAARFIWPVKGKVLSGFGPAAKGLHNDGINIAAAPGAQVKAADNGVVAYAGNELKGFGNLLLIKHADGWITAYAHNDKLLVKRGDEVLQGQVISTVGRTGNVDQPQLHFEIRQGTQSVDPLKHLEPAV